MAYTYDQLVLAYTNAHDGIGPDAATQATFQIQAVQSANGQQTDAQLLANIVNGADSTTGLAVLAYQFFTGKSPTKAGINYLVNSSVNLADLNDAYYSKFSLENRYINFAANLGVQGEGASNFAAKYGSLSFSDYVASIYQTIIGASYATAAGVDASKAIADIISRKDAILATATSAGMIPANATAAQIDIALKAATAGYLLGEAIKADVGLYAAAANNFMVAMVQGTAVYNTDITISYQPAVNTPSHGTGHALDNAPPVLPTPAPVVTTPPVTTPASTVFALTTGVDTLTGTSGDDTFTATNTTLQNGDTLNGGAGNDTLTLTAPGTYSLASPTVTGIETFNFTGAKGIFGNTQSWTGLTTANLNAQGGSNTSFTAATTTDVNATITNMGDNWVIIGEGHNITVVATGVTGDGTTSGLSKTGQIDADTSSNGFIDVTRTSTNAGNTATINTSGGSTVKVTQIAGNAVNTTQNNGRVNVSGGLFTTSAEVVNALEATADATTRGVTANWVVISDYNTVNPNTLGTLTTAKVDSYSYVSISDNVLTSLTLAHGHGDIDIDSNGVSTVGHATALTVGIKAVTSGTLHDFDNNYSTITFVTDTTASTLTGISSASLTTLNVSGNTGLTVTNSLASSASLHTATVTGAASLTATFGAGSDTITLGAGASTIDTGNGTDHVIVTAANAASNSVFSTLTVSPLDTLKITAQGSAAAFTGTMAAPVTGTTFQSYLDAAAAGDGHTTSAWSWFQFGGNTYVVLDSSAASTFQAGTDIVVKLVGAFNESGATITAGVLTIQ